MSPKQIRRGVSGKRSTTGMSADWLIHMGSKKRKKDTTPTEIECSPNDTSSYMEWGFHLNKNDSITNITHRKQLEVLASDDNSLNFNSGRKNLRSLTRVIDSPCHNSHLNVPSKKLKLSTKLPDRSKASPYSLKLSNNSTGTSLTSHRYTNRPQGTPRTLSTSKKLNSSRTLRSPKILPTIENSTMKTEGESTSCNSNDVQLKLHVSDPDESLGLLNCDTSVVLVKAQRKSMPSVVKAQRKSMPSVPVKYSLRKFLDPPKIVLKSSNSKAKSRKLKSAKGERTQLRRNNSTLLMNNGNPSENSINIINESSIGATTMLKNNTFTEKEPIVLLQRLPNIVTVVSSSSSSSMSPLSSASSSSSPSSQQQRLRSFSSSKIQINIDDQFANSNVNVSRKTCDSVLYGSGVTVNSRGKKRNSTKKRIEMECAMQENSVMFHFQGLNSTNVASARALTSSTPKDRQKLLEMTGKFKTKEVLPELNTTVKLDECNTFATWGNASKKMDEICEEEEVDKQNETYELIEPKTPTLRKRLREEQSVDRTKVARKKNFKVRLASSPLDTSYKLRRQAQSNEKRQPDSHVNVTFNSSIKKILKTSIRVTPRRSKSYNREIKSTIQFLTPTTKIDHRASPAVAINTASRSPFTTSVKKSDSKVLSAKTKIPNFVEIHKKMFAKSESVIDAKKRLKDRHTALTTTKGQDSTKTKIHSVNKTRLPSEANVDSYNRFGFKLKKREATNCILRNSNLHLSRNKEQNRAILKGVRTNRRFELQMKSRNMKL